MAGLVRGSVTKMRELGIHYVTHSRMLVFVPDRESRRSCVKANATPSTHQTVRHLEVLSIWIKPTGGLRTLGPESSVQTDEKGKSNARHEQE